MNALTTNACGQLVEAAAKHFGGLKAGRSCRGAFEAFEGWQTAGLNALTTDD